MTTDHITDQMINALVEQAHAIEADLGEATNVDDLLAVLSHLDIMRRQVATLKDAIEMELEDRRQIAEQLQGPIDVPLESPPIDPALGVTHTAEGYSVNLLAEMQRRGMR